MLESKDTVDLNFRLNGRGQSASISSSLTLIDLLRDRYGLTGTKLACSAAVCGSCTVLVDRKPAASCAVFAFQVEGADVETIEGMQSADGALSLIQQAFVDHCAFQCGYCTAGMIMLTKALLDHYPKPDREQVIEWVSSNVCRCTGYLLIIEAVLDAAQRIANRR